MSGPRFAISTFLFHQTRLDREHLVEIAAHGFDSVELFALRSHFDYGDPRAVAQLAEWLDDTRLSLSAVHAPTAEAFTDGRWHGTLSVASADAAARARAVEETRAALELARTLPYTSLATHVGVPSHLPAAAGDDPRAARESLDALANAAADCGVQLALEVQTNRLSTPEALVALIEDASDWPPVGICLDAGHARLMGDPADAVEAASGHIIAAHVHDTRGTRDDHLVPYDGVIDWDRTLLAFQKVGYLGPWTFELGPAAPSALVLARAAEARRRFEQALGIDDEQATP
ncbi:MAG: sugar phosphate isomerase/epimerase family protein [Vicinamibacterales bacterium]